jgi:aminoglycoside phosphotransferase family enzyme
MNLIKAFEGRKIAGLSLKIDKVIETAISKLYFSGDRVYKIYKYDKAFFGDFSNIKFRNKFYNDDYSWNNAMAPSIYTGLQGVKNKNNHYVLISRNEADDFYYIMNRVDTDKCLTNLLIQRQITENDLVKIAYAMGTRIKKLTDDQKKENNKLFSKRVRELAKEDVEDLRSWAYMAEPKLPKSKTDAIVNEIFGFIEKEDYLKRLSQKNLALNIDGHSDNTLFIDGEPGFIDIMPPKENWRTGDFYFNICRLATDVAVLWSKDKTEAMYEIYNQIALVVPPPKVRLIYEIRASLIRAAYFYILNKPELAEKYLEFLELNIFLLKG